MAAYAHGRRHLHFIAMAAMLFAAATSPASAKPVQAWRLYYHTKAYENCKLTITRTNACLDIGTWRCILQPPHVRTALRINDVGKVYMVSTVERTFSEQVEEQIPVKDATAHLAGSATISGFKCSKVVGTCKYEHRTFETEFFLTRDIPVGKQIADAASCLLGVPEGYGLPVRFRWYLHGDRRGRTILDMFRFEKATIDDSEVSLPKGYRRAKDKADLIFSQGKPMDKEDVDSLFIYKPDRAR